MDSPLLIKYWERFLTAVTLMPMITVCHAKFAPQMLSPLNELPGAADLPATSRRHWEACISTGGAPLPRA